jgi:hypothetical protein
MTEPTTIVLRPPDTVRITGVKINLVCTTCHRVWGVYLRAGWTVSPNSWVCSNCGSKNGESKDEQDA